MCLHCGKHHSENLWYLDEEKHRIRSLGLFRDTVAKHLNPLISVGLKMVRWKRPDYVNSTMNPISKNLLNWAAKTLHGMQCLPNIDSAFSIVNMANELALMPCLCRQAMDPDEPPVFRCIAMNIAAKIYDKHEKDLAVQPITKEQACDLIVKWRERGAWQAVGWLWDANVIWVCNCDEHCVGYRAPEADWGVVPSFMVTTVGKPSACAGCRECSGWCKHRAISYGEDGRVRVNTSLCKGCGLCIEHCPNQVLVFKARETFYDVRSKTVRHLGDATVEIG